MEGVWSESPEIKVYAAGNIIKRLSEAWKVALY